MRLQRFLIPVSLSMLLMFVSCEQKDSGCSDQEIPVPDFTADHTTVYPGDSIRFSYIGTSGDPVHLDWTFHGGTPSSAADKPSVTVVYEAPGIYDVNLKASYACGDQHKTKVSFVRVIPKVDTAVQTIYFRDFIPDTVISNPHPAGGIDFELDVNNDAVPDMTFQLSNWSYNQIIQWSTYAYGADSVWFIASNLMCSGPCITPIDSLMLIHLDDIQGHEVCLQYVNMEYPVWCECLANMKYVGFLLYKNGKKYIGWIRLKCEGQSITIDSYATLTCPFDSIVAGQH